MKGILVLLVLLNTQTTKVCTQPYQADSDRKCHNQTTEYVSDDSNLCCKKCPPGMRIKQKCSETHETVCEPCPTGQYLESWNFSPNCLSCTKCKTNKGLLYEQTCSSTSRSRCGCQPGKYCIMGYDGRTCGECGKYKTCPPGHGVSVQGTASTNVICERCPDGTFSNTVSSTDPCWPHTDCNGRVVRGKGNATSDNVCEPVATTSNTQPRTLTDPHSENVSTTASTVISAGPTTRRGLTNPTPSISTSVSVPVFNQTTKSPPGSTPSDKTLAAILSITIGVMLFCIAIILLFFWKKHWEKDGGKFPPKVDANGNETGEEQINPGYFVGAQLTSFRETSPEQHCLLVKGEACSDQSQSSSSTEASTRTDGCSSYESIGPLQSTIAPQDPHCALSEPMPLLSNIDPVTPQTSIPTQYSSQPTSPQIINPPATSPQFNVNINIHIGNGTGGTTPITPTDLMKLDSKLPFGEEEQAFSIPQQEAGKQSLTSVQESESYSS